MIPYNNKLTYKAAVVFGGGSSTPRLDSPELVMTNRGRTFYLTWTSVQNAQSYDIYVTEEGQDTYIIPDISGLDFQLNPNNDFNVYVVAKGEGFKNSYPSNTEHGVLPEVEAGIIYWANDGNGKLTLSSEDFEGAQLWQQSLDEIEADKPWGECNELEVLSEVYPYTCYNWFAYTGPEYFDITGINLQECRSMKSMFYQSPCKEIVITSDAPYNTSLESTFGYCSALKHLTVSQICSGATTTMYRMFHYCTNLLYIDGLDNFDTSNVTTFQECFYHCDKISILPGIKYWNMSSAETTNGMFRSCPFLQYLDLAGWNRLPVNTGSMFRGSTSLYSVDLSNADMSSVSSEDGYANSMFSGCTNLVVVKAAPITANGNGNGAFSNCDKIHAYDEDTYITASARYFLPNAEHITNVTASYNSQRQRIEIEGIENNKQIRMISYIDSEYTSVTYVSFDESSTESIVNATVSTLPTLYPDGVADYTLHFIPLGYDELLPPEDPIDVIVYNTGDIEDSTLYIDSYSNHYANFTGQASDGSIILCRYIGNDGSVRHIAGRLKNNTFYLGPEETPTSDYYEFKLGYFTRYAGSLQA